MKRRFSIVAICLALAASAARGDRLAAQSPERGLDTIVQVLGAMNDSGAEAEVLRGVTDALKGRRQVEMPKGWQKLYATLQASPDPEVRERALALALQFGDAQAFAAQRAEAENSKADPAERVKAIDALTEAQDAQTGKLLLGLLDDPAIRAAAIRDLPSYSEDQTPAALLQHFAQFSPAERRDAVIAMASRAAWGIPLLDAVEKGQVPQSDVSAFTVRQLTGLHNKEINQRLKKFYGSVRPPAKDKAKLIATFRKTFTPDVMAKADPSHGRAIFSKTCAVCHTLFDAGGKVGPDLTGSQRANLEYVLENVVDPSAVVAKDYYMTVIETKNGQTISGIIKNETPTTISIRDTVQETTLQKSDIKTRQTSTTVSLMPEGLLEALSVADARDLISYLASPRQVPAKE